MEVNYQPISYTTLIGVHSTMYLVHPNYNFVICACVCVCIRDFVSVCTYYVRVRMHVHVCACVFVGSYLATKLFIGNLLAMGRKWVIIKLANDERLWDLHPN